MKTKTKSKSKTYEAQYSRARKRAVSRLIALHKEEWDSIWLEESKVLGINTHAAVRKRRAEIKAHKAKIKQRKKATRVYTLEQRIAKIKKELEALSVS